MKAMGGPSIHQARQAKTTLRTDPRLPQDASIGIGKVDSGYVVSVNLAVPASSYMPVFVDGVKFIYEAESNPHAGGPGSW